MCGVESSSAIDNTDVKKTEVNEVPILRRACPSADVS